MKIDNPGDWLPTREEAVEFILSKAEFPVFRTQRVSLNEAMGRYLAYDHHARYDLPTSRTSNRDGIAFRYDDFVAASGDYSSWQPGKDYAFSNTGIAIHDEFDTTLSIENVEIEDGRLVLNAAPTEKHDMTSEVGSRLKAGALLVCAFTRLEPGHLGLLASGGYHEIAVIKQPDVAIIPSGNELVPPTMVPPRGKNIESNSWLLSAKVRSWGGKPHVTRIIPDDLEILIKTLRRAASENDIVLFNAGSSKGTDDFAVEALQTAGEMFFHRVSYGPGHHTSFSIVDGTPVLGLVGPPIGADFNADFYLRPLLDAYHQQSNKAPLIVRARLTADYTSPAKIQFYTRGIVRKASDGFEVDIVGIGDYITAYTTANCYICFDCGLGMVPAGSVVEVELREPYDMSLFNEK